MNRIKECLRLVRIANSLMVGLAVLVGLAIVTRGDLLGLGVKALALAYITGCCVSASSMVLNDIVDVEIDRVNQPNRPLVAGTISARTAWLCYLATSTAGITASLLLGPWPLVVAVLGWLVGSVYDVWGKRSGFPGNLMVAFSTSLPFPYAMAVAGVWTPTITVFWVMVFLTVLGREIAKDIADVEGDRRAGARTLPIILGEGPSSIIAGALYLAAVLLSPLPVYWHAVHPLAYTIFVAVVDAILIYEALRLARNHSREMIYVHKRNILLAMLLGLLGFMAGSIAG
ncbi:MAG: geranylgeranylglycerol-phosphate geranylgeranyltransferase [Desulfurococcales archaeon]|nr:geranylgeranylglycerol-phosphate geranylgeranyltransferase [Desulfurococcales archaeon]